MSEKEQSSQQTPSAGQEQTREGTRAPQGERAASSGGDAGRGRAGGGGGGGGRHGRRRHGQSSSSSAQQGGSRRNENSLNMQELRDLMDLFTSHGLTEFEIENEEIRVRLSRNLMPTPVAPSEGFQQPAPQGSPAAATQAQETLAATPATSAAASAANAAAAEGARAEEKAEDLHVIPSPIVGTFYRSPSPTAEPFVKQGSRVEPDTIVCIIEAMKLMNEIQAETTGVVEKIYVENGQPVEYGQPLFGIKK